MSRPNKRSVRYGLLSILIMLSFYVQGESSDHVYKSPDQGSHFYKVDGNGVSLERICSAYVSAYSHIYLSANQMVPLAVTLSIRNTDNKNRIYIKKVDYFDTKGKLIDNLTSGVYVLTPLATVSFVIEQNDMRGGAGANFVVEWGAEKTVNPPIFEAIMAGFTGTKGLSFSSRGENLQCSN